MQYHGMILHMLFAQANASSVSASPEVLKEAAAQVVDVATNDPGVQSVQDTASQVAQQATAHLPEYLSWVKHVDMTFTLITLVAIAILFYTVAKNTVAMTSLGIAFAFLIASQTPLLNWIPAIGNIPQYMVNIGTFVILAVVISQILFKSTFLEPMNIPTGREVLFFAVITTGFLITLGLRFWPVEETEQFSSIFQTLFVNQPMVSVWTASPVLLALALRGRF